jgi:integrase/recombinase XerD
MVQPLSLPTSSSNSSPLLPSSSVYNLSVAAATETGTENVSMSSSSSFDDKITAITTGSTGYAINLLKKQSKQNAATIADYVIALNVEVNPSIQHRLNQLTVLSYLSDFHKQKPFSKMTRDDILQYLDSHRRPEESDPLHKWIGTYDLRRTYLLRFFKWLYDPLLEPGKRHNPEVVRNIPSLKRKELSIYKPSHLWTEQDDFLFLKYCPNKRDRCYHMIARDSSCRPSEILGLKIRDIVFKTTGEHQYAEILVNGKTGTRHIPLFSALPYVKDWIDSHPQRGNPNAYLVPSLDRLHRKFGNKMKTHSLNLIYRKYKLEFFPSLLEDPKVLPEDKLRIKELLQKPFNPYIFRHSAITEKSKILKFHTLNQHCGWSPRSQMHLRYVHYFGNESSESLLEAYGILPKERDIAYTLLKPKQCPNCTEPNKPDSKFCAKCRMVLTYDAYNETLGKQQEKETEVEKLKEKYEEDMKSMRQEMNQQFSQIMSMIQQNPKLAQVKPEVLSREL